MSGTGTEPLSGAGVCDTTCAQRPVEVVWVDEWLHRTVLESLERRTDKTYSLCDAGSFGLMRAYGTTDALTTDRNDVSLAYSSRL